MENAEIELARSDDEGLTWSDPLNLSRSPMSEDWVPAVAANEDSAVVAYSTKSTSESGVQTYATSLTQVVGEAIRTTALPIDSRTIAIDADQTGYAVALDEQNQSTTLLLSTDGEHWAPPASVVTDRCYTCESDVAMDGNNIAIVQDIQPAGMTSNIRVLTSFDAGTTWDTYVPTGTAQNRMLPQVEIIDGRIVVAWLTPRNYTDYSVDVVYSDDGETWTEPRSLAQTTISGLNLPALRMIDSGTSLTVTIPGTNVAVESEDGATWDHIEPVPEGVGPIRYMVRTSETSYVAFTGDVRAIHGASASTPSAPQGVEVSLGNRTATVSWTAPANGGSPITGYTITGTNGAGSKSVDGSTTSTTFTGLTPGQTYTFTVTATNDIGDSPTSAASDPVTVPIPEPEPTAPVAPAKPTTTLDGTTATVTWAPPTDGGSPITGYTITGTNGAGAKTVDGSTTSTTFTGLTPGQTYTFTVTATNEVGDSPTSAPSDPVSPPVVNGPGPSGSSAPAVPAASIPDQVAKPTSKVKKQKAVITWAAPADGGAPIAGYTVTVKSKGAKKIVKRIAVPKIVLKKLKRGTYKVTVVAVNAAGASTPSAKVKVRIR